MTGPAVQIDRLTVRYGEVTAVRELSLTVPTGGISAILGPNGAGKSSVLRTLCTLVQPTAGTVRVFGTEVRAEPVRVRAGLGVVFQEPTLDRELSVERNLRLHARLYGVARADTARRLAELLASFGLADRRADTVDTLSGGLARRVEIARALLHRPPLLVLDEPTTGLDPDSRRRVWDDLRRLRRESGLTVLYSTHYMDEAEYADHIVIVRDGEVAQRGSPRELKAALGRSSLLLHTEDDDTALVNLHRAGFAALSDVDGIRVRAAEPERDVAAVVGAAGVPIRSVTVHTPTLDDVFLAVTGAEPDATAAEVAR